MSAITLMNVARAITKLVAADSLPMLMGSLVVGNLVTRDFEPMLASVGDAISLPNGQITLSTHVEATFQIPDVTKVLAVPDLMKVYMQPAVAAITQRIESDLLALYGGFTMNPTVGTAGTAITEATIDAAETALFLAKVPSADQKFIVVDAAAYSAWRQIPRFSEFQTAGDAGLRALIDGTVGRVKDFFVFRSQFVQKTGSNPVTTHNLAFTKNAIGLVVRRLPQPLPGIGTFAEYAELGNFGMCVSMEYQPNSLAQQFTVGVLYGCGILQNIRGVQILT